MKNIITMQEEVVIEQDDKKIILEKGDRIEVLKEERNFEDVDESILNEIDFSFLIKTFNSMNIPVKKIDAKFAISHGREKYINAFGGKFIGRDLGVFSNVIKEAELSTFNTSIGTNDSGELVWWATWSMNYIQKDGGSNGINFLSTWYNFDTGKWFEKR